MYLNKYYVYAYLREDSTPYYIGKGSGNRINCTQRTIPIPPKDRRIKLAENLSETEAFKLEIELIDQYGRIDQGTGILRNLSDGGKGTSGSKGRVPWNKGIPCSEETKQKIRQKNKGVRKSLETIEKLKENCNPPKLYGKDNPRYRKPGTFLNKTHTAETKKKISNKAKNRIWITNEIESKVIYNFEPIPEGWRRGRTL